MRALVTGSAGFLGSHILDYLLARGCEVVSYDVKPPHRSDVEAFIGDIRDRQKLAEATEGCDYIFHNAAIANIDDSRRLPRETMDVNVMGTVAALDAAVAAGAKRFVFASSVYASSETGSFYRVSKVAGELLCETYEREFGLPYTLIRYGSLYGRRSNRWNLVYNVCRDLLEKGEYTYNGTGEEFREFINVEDAARETARIAMDERYVNKMIMVSGHQRMRMKDFFTMVMEILPNGSRIRYESSEKAHYHITPYKHRRELPVRINMDCYIDIGEGILACLEEAERDIADEGG